MAVSINPSSGWLVGDGPVRLTIQIKMNCLSEFWPFLVHAAVDTVSAVVIRNIFLPFENRGMLRLFAVVEAMIVGVFRR